MATNYITELKKNLESENKLSVFFGEDHYEAYETGLQKLYEITENETPIAVNSILLVISKLISLERLNKLRICSLGCGNGVTDKNIILKILEEFPEVTIEYVGVEIDSTASTSAKELLSSLNKVAVAVYNQDLLQDIPEAKFDLVIALHSLYYIKSCTEGIEQAVKVTKDTGAVLVSLVREGPLYEPLLTIDKYMNSGSAIMSDKVADSFKSLNISYTVLNEFSNTIDLTKPILNDFKSHEDKCLLSLLIRSHTEYHSPATIQSCCNYFKAVAQRKEEKYLIPFSTDYLCSYGPFNI